MSINARQNIVRAAVGTLGVAVCAALCLAGASVPAHAATVETVRTARVGFADLDLSQPRGRAVLNLRIRAAARAVCEIGGAGSVERWVRLDEQRCFRAAVERATPQLALAADAR